MFLLAKFRSLYAWCHETPPGLDSEEQIGYWKMVKDGTLTPEQALAQLCATREALDRQRLRQELLFTTVLLITVASIAIILALIYLR